MSDRIDDLTVDFFQSLFARVFSEPFTEGASARDRRRIERRVEETADAASQALSRFLTNRDVTTSEAEALLDGLAFLGDALTVADVSNPNEIPEVVAEAALAGVPLPDGLNEDAHGALFRVSAFSTVQVLMRVGAVMREWQQMAFIDDFGLDRQVVAQLDAISAEADALGVGGGPVADERFELAYRDRLLQRSHLVDAGTLRMAAGLTVGLRELFVMPRVRPRPRMAPADAEEAAELMGLGDARRLLGQLSGDAADNADAPTALDHLSGPARSVVVGLPGSGKSTLLEWLQLQVAGARVTLVAADRQAIPVLLRVRELDMAALPGVDALVEAATGSRDFASFAPAGWTRRQFEAGRVLLLLDGVDEVHPDEREARLLPWLHGLVAEFPHGRYVVSSRPTGYAAGTLADDSFDECDLLHFDAEQMQEYARHWCTSVRLSRREPEAEAREQGAEDGDAIVAGFEDTPHIADLAQTPLMLSAICLVYYYERGELPDDRVKLYRMCVEGLLHNWDDRRGLRSDFSLEEQLRACRDLALVMQIDGRAESDEAEVLDVFTEALGDAGRARELLAHARQRAGLLVERRAGVFAFAHLTFQEYLAALAVYEGNDRGVSIEGVVGECRDGRWAEVIPLLCGIVRTPRARQILDALIDVDGDPAGALILEAFLAAGQEVRDDPVSGGMAVAAALRTVRHGGALRVPALLERVAPEVVGPIANAAVMHDRLIPRAVRSWLQAHPGRLVEAPLLARLAQCAAEDSLDSGWAHDAIEILCRAGSDDSLRKLSPFAMDGGDYAADLIVALATRGRLKRFSGPGAPGYDAFLGAWARWAAPVGWGAMAASHLAALLFVRMDLRSGCAASPHVYAALAVRFRKLVSTLDPLRAPHARWSRAADAIEAALRKASEPTN